MMMILKEDRAWDGDIWNRGLAQFLMILNKGIMYTS